MSEGWWFFGNDDYRDRPVLPGPDLWLPEHRSTATPFTWTMTTTTTTTPSVPIDEETVRRIVREEISQLPIRYDVPEVPPEA